MLFPQLPIWFLGLMAAWGEDPAAADEAPGRSFHIQIRRVAPIAPPDAPRPVTIPSPMQPAVEPAPATGPEEDCPAVPAVVVGQWVPAPKPTTAEAQPTVPIRVDPPQPVVDPTVPRSVIPAEPKPRESVPPAPAPISEPTPAVRPPVVKNEDAVQPVELRAAPEVLAKPVLPRISRPEPRGLLSGRPVTAPVQLQAPHRLPDFDGDEPRNPLSGPWLPGTVGPTWESVAVEPGPRLPSRVPSEANASTAALPDQPVKPAGQPVAEPAEVRHVPVPVVTPGNSREILRRARAHFQANELEKAEELALRASIVPYARWGLLEDSPRKLLDNIQSVRFQRVQAEADRMLADGRRLLEQGQLDEAEKAARAAEQLHGPYRLLEKGYRPQNLLDDIRAAREGRPQEPKSALNVLLARIGRLVASEQEIQGLPAGMMVAAAKPRDAASSSIVPVSGTEIQSGPELLPDGARGLGSPGDSAMATVVPAVLPVSADAPSTHAAAPVTGCCPTMECCPHCPGQCIFFGELGFAVLRPYWKNNPALYVTTGGIQGQIEHSFDAEFVPQFAVGMLTSEGWGGRIRWWGFDSSDTQTAAETGGTSVESAAPLGIRRGAIPGQTAVATGQLSLSVWDFEGLRQYQMDSWSLLLSGGLRYVHMAQNYDFRTPSLALLSGHNFDGAGPTLAVEARRYLQASPLYFYGTGRGALLFGRNKQAARANGTYAESSARSVLPLGELEFGLGWRSEWLNREWFVEGGLNSQVWWEAGNSSRSTVNPIAGDSATIDSNLGLFGIALRAGVSY